jgi:hypothetical protein
LHASAIFCSLFLFLFSVTTIVGPKISLDQKQFIVLKTQVVANVIALSFGFGLTTFAWHFLIGSSIVQELFEF